MPNFSFPASTQTDLDFFLTIFKVNFKKNSEELLNEFQNTPNLSMLFHATTSKVGLVRRKFFGKKVFQKI
jgi:hypothetical protein